jgi:hypothetical protein
MTSILAGEVKKEDVVVIITRTYAPDYDRFIGVVNAYYEQGNPYASNVGYSLGEFERDDVIDLAYYLWHSGKIHQPRTFSEDTGYVHEDLASTLWLDIVPVPSKYGNESVLAAWENYRTLAALVK